MWFGEGSALDAPWEGARGPLPCRILLAADFTHGADARPIEERRAVALRDSFDRVERELRFASGEAAARFRALRAFVERLGALPGVEPFLINASAEDVRCDFDDAPEPSKNGLYKILYTRCFGQGGTPFCAVLARWELDARLAKELAQVARLSTCPFFVESSAPCALEGDDARYLTVIRPGRAEALGEALAESFARTGFLADAVAAEINDALRATLTTAQVAQYARVHARSNLGSGSERAATERGLAAWIARYVGPGRPFAEATLGLRDHATDSHAYALDIRLRPSAAPETELFESTSLDKG